MNIDDEGEVETRIASWSTRSVRPASGNLPPLHSGLSTLMAATTIIAHAQTATTSYSRTRPVDLGRNQSFSSATGGYENGVSQSATVKSPPPLNPNMSFTMSQGSQSNGLMLQPSSSFRQHTETNGSQTNGATPQIYSAVYSGVDVYEMEVNGVAVMRRRNDSWLNATQILKVAGIDKGKRTKVLEKEILIGEHEKVQGGYGKYQGTWIKFERGLEFCRSYGVEEMLRPLLTYDMGQDGGIAGRGGVDTPTKEQAMAAQRKRLYNSGSETRLNGQSGTFFKNISSTASHAVAAISKARYDSPAPRMRNGSTPHRPSTFSRQSSQQHLDSQEAAFPGGSQQSMQSFTSENSFGLNGHDSAYATQSAAQFSYTQSSGDFQEPPRKRMRPSPSVSMSQQTNEAFYDQSLREASPTEPNESFVYHQQSQNMDQDELPMALPPLPMTQSKIAESKRALLMSLFMNPSQTDFTDHEAFLTLSGEDLDMPIDNTAHTALHWAATLARMPLLRALIASGASIYRVNGGGETSLMRACVVKNNLDNNSFPDLLELLGPTIEMRDDRGRTVLHHIAVTSAVKGRSQASKYYLESLLEFVVRQGSAPNSQQNYLGGLPATKSMGIGRFMSEIVNAQDKSGDTALNIAARIGNRSIISQLLEVGADAGIPNRAGLRPVDFGIGGPAELGDRHPISPEKQLSKTKENSGDIISSITSLLNETEREFTNEMEAKQSQIDSIHAQLRDSSAQLGEERRHLERLQARTKEREERKQKINNLKRATDEERYRLSQMQQQQGHMSNGDIDLRLGDADKPYTPLASASNLSPLLTNLSPHDSRLVASLPSASILQARLNAYMANNHALSSEVRGLKSKSRDLEAKYRRIISLCTRVEEEKVDAVLGNLCRAVDSEMGDMELGRVRDFLQKVEGVELV